MTETCLRKGPDDIMAAGTKLLPTPKSLPIIGTLGALIAAGGAQNLHKYVDQRHKELGPIYKEKIGPVTGIFISSPELMRRIFASEGRYPRHIIPEAWQLYNEKFKQQRGLLFMDGEEWYRYRSLLNGIFLKPDQDTMAEALTFASNFLIKNWNSSNGYRTIENDLYQWSLESILAVLLSTDGYARQRNDLIPIISCLSNGVHRIFTESAKLSLMSAKMAMTFNIGPWRRFIQAANESIESAKLLLERITQQEIPPSGLLHKLLQLQIDKGDMERIVVDLIMAAGDTTANTMQWLLYLLGKYPEVQSEIYEEVKNLDAAKTVENALIKGTVRETLRLYPVAPFLTRYLPEQLKIDDYVLEKDDLIIMSLYTSGRLESCFAEPLLFQPKRWVRNGREYNNVKNSQGSLPFAIGSRSCIGRKIAEVQIAVTAAKILKTYNVDVKDKTIEIALKLITTPNKPVHFKFSER